MTKNLTSEAAEKMYKGSMSHIQDRTVRVAIATKFIAMEEILKDISKMDYEDLYEKAPDLCKSALAFDPLSPQS